MPTAPKRYAGGKNAKPKKAWRTTTGSSTQRGYGADWQRLRNAYITEYPLCERCEAEGIIREADEVHHKESFNGLDDPLRLDWGNLESICTPHHLRETGGRKRGGGGR